MLSLLATWGLDFVKNLVTDHGETLAKEGIKKVTGIDLDRKEPLTSDEILLINSSKLQIKELDFKALELEYQDKQNQRNSITKRWESDNKSDSRIAKLTRPGLVIYLVFIVL